MKKQQHPKRKQCVLGWLGRKKIGIQMAVTYFFAIVVPIGIIGGYIMWNTYQNQVTYRQELLQSYHSGVKQTVYEISAQIYSVSDSIVYNDELIAFLRGEYESDMEVRQAASRITLMDKYMESYTGIEDVVVYVDREDMVNFKQFQVPTEQIKETDWYQKAQDQFAPFWVCSWLEDGYGNYDWRLALVRKMILVDGDAEAVIMIKIRNSYLASRIANKEYVTMLSVDDMPVFYCNWSEYRGDGMPVQTEPEVISNYGGMTTFEEKDAIFHFSSLDISRTSSDMYLMTYDANITESLRHLMGVYLLILLAAVLLPLIILTIFTRNVVTQVKGIRAEMGKASRGEYEMMQEDYAASEELSEAFEDLRVMVKNIQKMEADQYEAQINEKNIQNEQQKMEFKVLASQINPHFLYNTLETIRMKAFTAGDKEVANAIKLLGKSMRYVLENTGTEDTTMQKEFDHVMTYLQIQQLRFGERVTYQWMVQPGLDLERLRTLPLLLQPIVENAVVHGLESKEAKGCVWLAFYIMEGKLHIDISDNGGGMDAETLEKVRRKVENYTKERHTSSIALYNINRRIKLNYGETFGLEIDSTLGEGTMVRVRLPVISDDPGIQKLLEAEK